VPSPIILTSQPGGGEISMAASGSQAPGPASRAASVQSASPGWSGNATNGQTSTG
jgi:hypothetical protein